MAADSDLSSIIPNETLDESSSSPIPSIGADSGISSRSSIIIPNSVENLDDSSSSSQIASINTDVVAPSRLCSDSVISKTLDESAVVVAAQSSLIRDSDSMEATDGSSSSSSSIQDLLASSSSPISECNDTQIKPESSPLRSWGLDSYHRRRRSRWFYEGSDSDDNDDDDTKLEPFLRMMITGVGAGLWNLGNTCFINSVLQCFTHTVPLIHCLRSHKFKLPCNCENFFCVIRALKYHINNALQLSRFPIQPYYFVHNLNYFSPYFQRFQQEDAHEFLQAFLDKLERCCVDRRSNRDGEGDGDGDGDVNIVDHVFTGRLVSGLRCCKCNSVSETFESSLGLSLGIEDADTLCSALELFTSVEKLEEQMTCDECNEKVSKEKRLMLDKLPLIATFHLKRFKNNGFFMEKIFKHVKIPLEIDLQPYMRVNQENNVCTKYNLYAFVEHLGVSLAYGHYSSYVRSAPNIWHHFDDVQVTRVDEDDVLSQDPYILFYARQGTPWFSTVYEEMFLLFLPSPKSVLIDPNNNGECLSEISYENNNNKPCDSAGVVSNVVSLERNRDVSMEAEEEPSGEDDGTWENFENDDPSDNLYTEKKPKYDDELVPRPSLLIVLNRDSSPKQQGTLQTVKNREDCKAVNGIVDSKEAGFGDDLMKKALLDAQESENVVSVSNNEELFQSAQEFSREFDDYDDDDEEEEEEGEEEDEEEDEEDYKPLSEIVRLRKKGSPCGGAARELDQGIAFQTGSPSKKMKTE